MLVYIWVGVLLAALWLYIRQVYSRFSKSGVKHFQPVPFLGDMGKLLLKRDHFAYIIERVYNEFPEERFVGRYDFTTPMVIIKDLDLLKKIAVKDFEYFLDHRTLIKDDKDLFFARNLFFLKGDEWKDMRSTLSPAFTSSKIRLMLPFMVEVGNQMIAALKKKIKESNDDYIDIDCKDLTTRYANDVIATCAFGLKVDSLAEADNQFYRMGKATTELNFKETLIFFAITIFPSIKEKFKATSLFAAATQFFKDLVLDTMNMRETKHIIRPDMIHLLMEAKKGRLRHEDKSVQDADAGLATVQESNVGKRNTDRVWNDDDLVAQAIIFFVAGFETVSSAMSFALHELAVNPEVQEKLLKEIRENETKTGGKFDYNSIQNMTYMDMVVSEVLRIWPPAGVIDRMCTKDYNLGKPNDKATEDYTVRKGETILIPAWALHRDPQYFPNPDKFDPERFSEENRRNIEMAAYMPFGVGPRNCIGSRFALCEVKVMLYQLLLHMELSPAAKTCIPGRLSTESINIRLKGGHWVRMRSRD